LCPTDHKIVDEQVTYYTEQRLHDLKREHEQWVKYRLSPTTTTAKIRDPQAGKPITLQHIATGKALMNVLAHNLATHYSESEPQSPKEAELIGAFLQSATDYIDTWDDIEPSERIEAEFWLSGEITRLREAGLVVYASARNHVVEGGVEVPAPWPVAYLVIRRNNDETIKDSPTDK
jgi:hypothetical protein